MSNDAVSFGNADMATREFNRKLFIIGQDKKPERERQENREFRAK